MNIEERNVLTIATISRIVENTLWYCLPKKSQSPFSNEERLTRYKALVELTGEDSPFYINAKNNGERGEHLLEMMKYFIEDCYSEKGRIITADIHGNVVVEESLIVELYSSIVELRSYLESFLKSGIEFLKSKNLAEDLFVNLVNDDIRYFHAFAAKVGSILLVSKFKELNETAKTYTQVYSQTNSVADPKSDPNFNLNNDPSFRMVENEFHTLNQSFVTALNTYGDDDSEFKICRQNIYEDSEIFTGKKHTTDMNKYFEIYTSYFDKILTSSQEKVNDEFLAIGKEVTQFELNLQKEALNNQEENKEDSNEETATKEEDNNESK